jgi:predicted CoA-binding protein
MSSTKSVSKQTLALRNAKRFVVYGLSRSLKGYAKDVVDGIKVMKPDTQMTIVHPDAPPIEGFQVIGSATGIDPCGDCLALIILNGKSALDALTDVSKTDIKKVWLVMNAYTLETAKFADDKGLEVVKGCPLLFVDKPEGFHRFHWQLARLFGRV